MKHIKIILIIAFGLFSSACVAEPSDSDKDNNNEGGGETSSEVESDASPVGMDCLVQDDYKHINYNRKNDSVEFSQNFVWDSQRQKPSSLNKQVSMFFKPDSSEEESLTSIYDDIANFAKVNEDKQWKFHIQGSSYSPNNAEGSEALSLERTEAFKDALVSRGVMEDRIVEQGSIDTSKVDQTLSNNKEIYRKVSLWVNPTCNDSNTGK